MPSPTCTVNAASAANGANVAATTAFTIELADSAGVSQWSLECIGTDDATTAAAVNAALTMNLVAKTASHTGLALGTAAIFRSRVNNGQDVNGTPQSSYETTFGVYCLTSGGYRVIAVHETTEGSASFGWIKQQNAIIRAGGPDFGAAIVKTTGGVVVGDLTNGFGGRLQGRVSTTDATATTGLSYTPPANCAVKLDVEVIGRRSDSGSEVYSTRIRRLFTVAAGAVTAGAAATKTGEERITTVGCDADIDTSGGAIRVRVTGVAAQTWRWEVVADLTVSTTTA